MDSPRKSSTLICRLWTGSIRRRLILAISALLALVMSVFVADMPRRQVHYLHQESRSEVLVLARMLAANSVSWVLASDLAGLQEVVQVLKGYPDVRYAMILTPEGKVLAHTDPQLPGRYARDAISESLRRAPLTPQLLVDTEALVEVAAPIEANGALIGWARVSLGQDRVNANFREIARNGILYAALAIALGILLAVILTRGLTRDLARLVKAARRIGAGERGVQSGLAREDELGALSSTFDRMTLDLDRANQELRKSEKDLKEAQRLAQIGSWDWDMATDTISWSEEYYRIYGFDPTQRPPGYQEHLKAYTPESAARLDAAVKTNTQTGEPYELELELARTEGPRRWITARSEAKRDAQGQITGLRGTAQDISARKQAEDALREREEYIGKLVDKSPLAMVVSSGTEQRVEYLNQKFTALFGYTIADMPDVSHWWPLAYPEEKYREEIKAKWSERVTRAIESKGEIEPIEATVRCKDGSFRYIEFRLASIGARNLVTFVDLTERKRAEQTAIEQFKLAETFFSSNVSGLVILDRNFNFVRVNEAYARACRREIGDFAGRNHFDMYPSDAQAIFEEVVRSKHPFTTFTRAFVYPDQPERGTTYWDWTLAPILDAKGEVEYLIFSLNEVTERKRAEENQRTAALYARSLIEASLDPLVTISSAGKITDVNKATEDVTGIARNRLIGADFADYFTEPDKARTGYQEVLARGYVRDYPLTIRHSSGRTTDVLYNATVYRDEAGELQGVFAAARDVTEIKRVEGVLRDSELNYRTLADSAPALIWTSGTDKLCNYFNQPWLKFTGRTLEQELGNGWAEGVHADDFAQCLATYTKAFDRCESFSMEYRLRRHDGEFRWMRDDGCPRYDSSGEFIGYLGYVIDITHSKRQAERNASLLELSTAAETLDEKTLLQRGLDTIEQLTDSRIGFLHFVSENQNEIELVTWTAETMAHYCQAAYDSHYPVSAAGIWADCIRLKQPLIVNDYTAAPGKKGLPEGHARLQRFISVPIFEGELIRMIVGVGNAARDYGEHDLETVQLFAYELNRIVQRKRAEEQQRAAALYARSLIEASLDPLVTISPAGKITDVNKTTEDVTGIARDRLVGTDFADYFTEPDKARAGYQEVLARGYVRDYPLTIRHSSERTADVLYNATVYRNEAGELQGVFAAARDVTERKQAEAVRAQLAAIVQSSHDAIIGKDLDGVITSWNPGAEKVYGYRAEEIIGKSVTMLAPEGREHEITDLIENIRRAEAVINFDTERLRKDGKLIDISLDLSPIRDAAGRIVGASTIARDITEKKQAERALRKVNRALKALSSCNEILIHATDETRLLNEICRVIVDIEGYRLAWVGYIEHDAQKTVRPVAQSGYEPGYMEHTDISWADNERGRGPLGIAIRSGQIQVVQDVSTDPRFEPWRANAARLGYGSVLVAPLLSDSKVIGALSIHAGGGDAFDAAEVALLSELAADMAFGIVTLRTRGAHEQNTQRLQRSMEATIQVIAGTVEMRDPYTAGHQRRVAELATAIARDMGLAEEQVHGIHLASVVHDLGKVHIPAEILSKPGKLSAIEFELIKSHSEAGYNILKVVDFPWPIAQIVFQHHERLDGSGYPRGLKANEILLEAKILMVADVVEAMASHRPYRPAVGIELALQEISANAGKCYDADVVRVCLALFREKAFTFKI